MSECGGRSAPTVKPVALRGRWWFRTTDSVPGLGEVDERGRVDRLSFGTVSYRLPSLSRADLSLRTAQSPLRSSATPKTAPLPLGTRPSLKGSTHCPGRPERLPTPCTVRDPPDPAPAPVVPIRRKGL
jgi:hypothetical protein